MIGKKIQFKAPSEAVPGQFIEMTAHVLDKVNTASIVGDQNNEGHVIQQDCYVVANSNDKTYVITPMQIIKIYPGYELK